MDRLKLALASALATCSVATTAHSAPAGAAATADRISQWDTIITDAAQRFGIPDAWIRGVMRAESAGRAQLNGKPITSPKGAMGLMQVMPQTYRDLSQQYGLGADAYDPRDNILAAAAYLRQMYDRYGYPSLFAAYNAGPKRLDGFLLHGQALPSATLSYVESIAPGSELGLSTRSIASPLAPLDVPPTTAVQQAIPPRDGLFFDRKDVSGAANSSTEFTAADVAAHSSSPAFVPTNAAGLFVPLSHGSQ